MSNHPINLLVRFILEIILLVIFVLWGWRMFDGSMQYILAIGLPLIAATAWGVFRAKGDQGKGLVDIPGWLRLLYELTLFVSAGYMLFDMQLTTKAYIFSIVSTLHYLVSFDRIIRLLK